MVIYIVTLQMLDKQGICFNELFSDLKPFPSYLLESWSPVLPAFSKVDRAALLSLAPSSHPRCCVSPAAPVPVCCMWWKYLLHGIRWVFFVCLFMCVCVFLYVRVYMYTCTCTHKSMCMHVEARGWHTVSSLVPLHLIYWGRVFVEFGASSVHQLPHKEALSASWVPGLEAHLWHLCGFWGSKFCSSST